jgi:hypothetical protein
MNINTERQAVINSPWRDAIRNHFLEKLTEMQIDYAKSALYCKGFVNPLGITNTALAWVLINEIKSMVEEVL